MIRLPTTPVVESTSKVLKTKIFGHPIEGHYSLNSSNTLAAQKASEGAPEGSTIVVEEQLMGRGRQGRKWKSSAGQNLLFSIILRPKVPATSLGLLMLSLSIGMYSVIERWCSPVPVSIKWPNDILILEKKCCGILVESTFSSSQNVGAVILGIGLNVNQIHFPEELESIATSMALATGNPIPRAPLLADILLSLEKEYILFLESKDKETLIERYTRHLDRKGQRVSIVKTGTDERISGTLMGIHEDGGLVLLTPEGRQIFYAGEVSFNG